MGARDADPTAGVGMLMDLFFTRMEVGGRVQLWMSTFARGRAGQAALAGGINWCCQLPTLGQARKHGAHCLAEPVLNLLEAQPALAG